jgi:hypothetical protein
MSHNHDGGKGDAPRPMPNKEQFDKNFDLIFRKEKKDGDKTKTNDQEAND